MEDGSMNSLASPKGIGFEALVHEHQATVLHVALRVLRIPFLPPPVPAAPHAVPARGAVAATLASAKVFEGMRWAARRSWRTSASPCRSAMPRESTSA